MAKLFNFSYRKVGGLHFVKLGRFGCSFYLSRCSEPLRTHARPIPAAPSDRYKTYSSAAYSSKELQGRAHKFY